MSRADLKTLSEASNFTAISSLAETAYSTLGAAADALAAVASVVSSGEELSEDKAEALRTVHANAVADVSSVRDLMPSLFQHASLLHEDAGHGPIKTKSPVRREAEEAGDSAEETADALTDGAAEAKVQADAMAPDTADALRELGASVRKAKTKGKH